MTTKKSKGAAIPPCAAEMGCLCAGHARGNPADAPCDTNESTTKRWTAAELRKMPTLATGQADDLKVDENLRLYDVRRPTRVWLSRCGVEDGEPFNNKITVEELIDPGAVWVTAEELRGLT